MKIDLISMESEDSSPPTRSGAMALTSSDGEPYDGPEKGYYYGVTFRPVERRHKKLCSTLAQTFLDWTVKWGYSMIHSYEEYVPFRHIHATIRSSERIVYKDVMMKGYHIFMVPIYDLPKWIAYCEKTVTEGKQYIPHSLIWGTNRNLDCSQSLPR